MNKQLPRNNKVLQRKENGAIYTIDQGFPCPLATLNPFGRELLLSDVSTGIKWSTWIERSMNMNMNMTMNMTMRVM
jgi:hypothetical protein